MKTDLCRILAICAIAAAGSAAAGEITLYESAGFRGRSVSAEQAIADFADIGFNDRAASIVIRRGAWQICSDAQFRGRCVTLNPGEYPSLDSMGLALAISSVREIGSRPDADGAGRAVLYDGSGFSGRAFSVSGIIANFDPLGFNDRALTMIVHEGNWELCSDANFGGYCQTFGPGRHANLGRLSGQLSSMRPVRATGGGGSRAILYEGPHMTGRSFTLGGQVMTNLDGTGFNDRVSSIRIEAGYWIFCSDAHFGGECRTFGPGDYPTLPWALDNRISSGRRIHATYPHSTGPNWPAQ